MLSSLLMTALTSPPSSLLVFSVSSFPSPFDVVMRAGDSLDVTASSESQLSGALATELAFSSLFSLRLRFFSADFDKGTPLESTLDPGFSFVSGGGAQPMIWPFGRAIFSACCCRDPLNRLRSSWGVKPGRILISFRTLSQRAPNEWDDVIVQIDGKIMFSIYLPSERFDSGTTRSSV